MPCLASLGERVAGRGRVQLDGTTLSSLSAASIARQGIGRVFQHPELVADLSVHDNLMIACHGSLQYGLGSELLRFWVDDANATPGDLDAITRPDEAAWRDERAAFLMYK